MRCHFKEWAVNHFPTVWTARFGRLGAGLLAPPAGGPTVSRSARIGSGPDRTDRGDLRSSLVRGEILRAQSFMRNFSSLLSKRLRRGAPTKSAHRVSDFAKRQHPVNRGRCAPCRWAEVGRGRRRLVSSQPAVRGRDLPGPNSRTWGRPSRRSRGGSVPSGRDAVGRLAAGVAPGRPARTRRASLPVIRRDFDRNPSAQGASHRVGTGYSAIRSLGTSSPFSPGSHRRGGEGARVIDPEARPSVPPGGRIPGPAGGMAREMLAAAPGHLPGIDEEAP